MQNRLSTLCISAALMIPILLGGCAVRARVYDPYYHDYHPWAGEDSYYLRWEHDTHRDHMDFNRRNDNDKKEYWDYRHNQH